MLITVVIPTYQRPQLLMQCLKALEQQLLSNESYEVIAVSDGPDEATRSIVNQFNSLGNFRHLSLPAKKGPAAARNLGWLSAKAPVIAFTDDDCIPDANWLNEILKVTDPSTAQAFTGRVVVPRSARPTDHELNTAGLETADFVTANCVCTKAALLKVGGFDERFSMAWREDSDLEFKLLLHNIRIKKIPQAVIVHPVRKAKWGSSLKDQKKTMYNALLYRKYPDFYRSKIQPEPPYLYYFIICGFLGLIIGLVASLPSLAAAGGLIWLTGTVYFIFKRLYGKNLSLNHIIEMVYTSLLIPFYSIYWQWYGAYKYRVFLI